MIMVDNYLEKIIKKTGVASRELIKIKMNLDKVKIAVIGQGYVGLPLAI